MISSSTLRRSLFVLFIALFLPGSAAIAVSPFDIKKSEYSRYLFCMGRALGNDWHAKNDIRLELNSYGESHPTASSMMHSPANIQRQDAKCRDQNNLHEARTPSGPGYAPSEGYYSPPRNMP
jgi:hypothetical protein